MGGCAFTCSGPSWQRCNAGMCLVYTARVPPRRVVAGSGSDGKPSEEMYEGEVVAGLPHGFGCLILATGFMYEGSFFRGLPHGWGVLTDARWVSATVSAT